MASQALSARHILNESSEFYAKNGYVIAKQVFGAPLLEALKSSLRSVLAKNGHNGSASDDQRTVEELILARESEAHSLVYNASQSVGSSAAAYQLLGKSGIFDVVTEATGFELRNLHLTPMYLIVQLPNDERFDYVWHQDRAYYPWSNDMVTLWFPVNRATTRDTGTIGVIPGSHQSGLRSADTSFRHGFFRQVESTTEQRETDQEFFMELEASDCCVINGDTVHRSVANRASSPRVAGVVRMVNIGNLTAYERERFYCVHKS
jgi:ectoine hydroxylase-related dioxygenase (phytanoyl-CoA dioxygenase family)